jgi:hypothetical protein
MKKYSFLSIISFMILSCGGNDALTLESLESDNTAPKAPSLVTPINNQFCLDSSVAFQWNLSTDANEGPIRYQIEVAKDNQFSDIVEFIEVTSSTQTIELEKNEAYYWRVKAIDSNNLFSEYSPTQKLHTAGEAVVNYSPFPPELIASTLNTNSNTVTLEWNASDVDNTNDELTYDVYFGTENPPLTRKEVNLNTKTLTVPLEGAAAYFWKIVVKDNKGGETTGQVWRFIKEDN